MNTELCKQIVGVSDMKVSSSKRDEIITYALGSCIAVMVYDPVAVVGGMLHFQLPKHTIPGDGSFDDICRYADTGVPYLFKRAYALGAEKRRMVIKICGGGKALMNNTSFDIGRNNYIYLRKMLWKNNVLISAEKIGNTAPLTCWLEMDTGKVFMKMKGEVEELV